MAEPSVTITTPARDDSGRIKTLDQLLVETQVDQSKWQVEKLIVNKWDALRTTADGVIVEEMFQVKALLKRGALLQLTPADTRAYPPVTPGTVYNIDNSTETAVFLPDFQIGYEWNEDFTYLDPFHDRAAIECAVQFLADTQPDYVYILGDYLDLPEYSKFERRFRGHRFKNTTQAAIEEGYYWLRRIRDAVGAKCKIFFIKGNHDIRLNKELKTINEELTLIRPAGDKVPAMSFESLLRFAELGIVANRDYDDPIWLWDQVCVRHGEEYSNVSASKLTYFTVQGHCHDIVYDLKTIWGPQGPQVVGVMSPGCFCRLDGPIPKFSKQVDWQHGIGLAVKPVDGPVHVSVLPMHNARVYHGYKVYNAQNPDDIALGVMRATGVKQLVR